MMLDAFSIGARAMARDVGGAIQEHGFQDFEWQVLTADYCWRPDQQVMIPGLIARLADSTMVLANLPRTRLPGQYVAALIVEVVKPCNIVVACWSAPDTFDASAASGEFAEFHIAAMPPEQILSLAMRMLGGDRRAMQPEIEIDSQAMDQMKEIWDAKQAEGAKA